MQERVCYLEHRFRGNFRCSISSILVVGPEDLPKIARTLALWVRK
jgi:hypothetical protein